MGAAQQAQRWAVQPSPGTTCEWAFCNSSCAPYAHKHLCHHRFQPGSETRTCGCLIGGEVFPHLGLNPDLPCLRCDVTIDNTAWTPVPNDQICDPTLQADWANLPSQACTYNHVCSDSVCIGLPYSCPPLQACEAPVEAYPHVCDQTGPGSTTGGCQVELLPAGTVCAPQVHGCLLESQCNGITGTCPPQVELSGIIFQDNSKGVSPILPSGEIVASESPVMPSLTTASARYSSFRAECGELRLRQAVIPDGTCSENRVSDKLGGYGLDFDAPPRGGFELLVATSESPVSLYHVDELSNNLFADTGSGLDVLRSLSSPDLSGAVGPEFSANGVAEPFIDVEVRREHAINLRSVVLVDVHGSEAPFHFPAASVPGEWVVVSGKGEDLPEASFDWTQVTGARFIRDGAASFSVPAGTLLLSVRRMTLRTRAQSPPCPFVELLPVGGMSEAALAESAGTTAWFALNTSRIVDLSALYDTSQNNFHDGVHVVAEVATDFSTRASEIQLVSTTGDAIDIPVTHLAEATPDETGLPWSRIETPLHKGMLPATWSDEAAASIVQIRVGFPVVHAGEHEATAVKVGRVVVTQTRRCAHAHASRQNGVVSIFVSSPSAPAIAFEPVSQGDINMKPRGSPARDIAGTTFDFDISSLFSEACHCFRNAVLDMEISVAKPSDRITAIELLQLATGHGLRVDMDSAAELPSVVSPAAPARRRVRVAMDGPAATLVGPIENWENVNVLRVEGTATSMDTPFILHHLRVERVDTPCVSSTALPPPGFVEPRGVVASDVPVSRLAVTDSTGRLSWANNGDSQQSRQAGVWHDGGEGGDDVYTAATVLQNGRGESLVVAVGDSDSSSQPRFASLAVAPNTGSLVAARHARTAAGAWAVELGPGVTGYSVTEAVTSSLQSSVRRLADTVVEDVSVARPRNRRLSAASCPVGFVPSTTDSEVCYGILPSARNYLDAQKACSYVTQGRGNLAHPTTAGDRAQLIALTDAAGVGSTVWLGLRRVYANLLWDDGIMGSVSEVYHQTFVDGCFLLNTQGVREASCGTGLPAACEWRSDRFDTCPPTWHALHGKCVHLETQSLTFQEAEANCKNIMPGAELVSVRSAVENDGFWVFSLLGASSTYFGLNDIQAEGHFRWLEGDAQAEYNTWLVSTGAHMWCWCAH